jgi:hypothetical protein
VKIIGRFLRMKRVRIFGTDTSKLRDHMVDAGVRGIASAAFRYGFRKEELQNLLCRQVNFADKNLHLYQGTAKNSQPRKVVLDSASLDEIKEAARGKGPDDYVFTWPTGNKKGTHSGLPNVREHSMRSS